VSAAGTRRSARRRMGFVSFFIIGSPSAEACVVYDMFEGSEKAARGGPRYALARLFFGGKEKE